MSYTLNQRFLVGKAESSPGVMETPDSASFNVRVRSPEVAPIVEWNDDASKYANGFHGEDEAVAGAQSATISFSVRLGMGDTVSAAPNYSKYFNACGLKGAAYGSTGYGFQPLKEYDNKTITLWVFDCVTGGATPGAVVYKFAGCMGTCTIGCEGIGKPWIANFSFTGKLMDIADVAYASIPIATDMAEGHPEKNLNTSLAYGSVTQKVSSWSLDLGNEINPVINQADITGYDYYQITNRKPRFAANPLMQTVTTENVWGNMLSGLTGTQPMFCTGMNLQSGTTGMRISVPRAQQIQANLANREGIINWDASWRLLGNGYTGALADSSFTGASAAEVTFEVLIGTRA